MENSKMKRIICLLFCFIILFAFCSCSSSKNIGSESSSTQTSIKNQDITSSVVTNSDIGESAADCSKQTEATADNELINTTEKHDKITNPNDTDNTSQNQNVEEQISEKQNDVTQTTACSHNNTSVKNNTSATCSEIGYTGDTYCIECDKVITYGSQILTTGHNTEIRNKKDATTTSEGYTGDKVCKTCNTVVENGTKIPKIENNTNGKVTYTTSNGYTYVVDEGTNIMEYSMKQQTKYINSPYREFELEILRLCNEERAKNGLSPLTWYEDAYYFTYIRAEESSETFSHTRPNWSNWDTVYTDAGVILHDVWGENLFYAEGWPAYEIAEEAVKNWMDSPGHKANILNPEYTRLTVAIYEKYIGEVYCLSVTQNFFG